MNETLKVIYVPITKADSEKHIVEGYASTDTEDSQGEIIEPEVMQKALAGYMKFANVRAQHDPTKAVGKTKEAKIDEKGLYVSVKVVDADAWEKVKEGVFNGFSVGLVVLRKIGNKIVDCLLKEISLVDRPANPDCVFDVVKSWEARMAADKPEVKKSMYDVSSLAQALDNLHNTEEFLEQQLEIQGRTSEAHKMLEQVVADLAKTLNALTAEETSLLIGGETKEAKMDKPEVKSAPAVPAVAPVPAAPAPVVKADADPMAHFKAIHGAIKGMKEAAAAHKDASDAFHKAHKEACDAVHKALKGMGYAAPKEDEDAVPAKEEAKPKDDGKKADEIGEIKETLQFLGETLVKLTEKAEAPAVPLPARTEIPQGVVLMGKGDKVEKSDAQKTDSEVMREIWANPKPMFAEAR